MDRTAGVVLQMDVLYWLGYRKGMRGVPGRVKLSMQPHQNGLGMASHPNILSESSGFGGTIWGGISNSASSHLGDSTDQLMNQPSSDNSPFM